jgi:hypothetical protein
MAISRGNRRLKVDVSTAAEQDGMDFIVSRFFAPLRDSQQAVAGVSRISPGPMDQRAAAIPAC